MEIASATIGLSPRNDKSGDAPCRCHCEGTIRTDPKQSPRQDIPVMVCGKNSSMEPPPEAAPGHAKELEFIDFKKKSGHN
jgi:hypothetical protein